MQISPERLDEYVHRIEELRRAGSSELNALNTVVHEVEVTSRTEREEVRDQISTALLQKATAWLGNHPAAAARIPLPEKRISSVVVSTPAGRHMIVGSTSRGYHPVDRKMNQLPVGDRS